MGKNDDKRPTTITCNMNKRKLRLCIIALDSLIATAPGNDGFTEELSAEFVMLYNKLRD